MTLPEARIVDRSGAPIASSTPEQAKPAREWPPIIVPRELIDSEIERLAALERPANGRRQSLLVHPSAPTPGRGLTPGVQVTLDVLKPGEETDPIRHNSTQVSFCIRGQGCTRIGDRIIHFERHDVWSHPSWQVYSHRNDGDELQARLTYSNAALLEMMRVHLVDENPPPSSGTGDRAGTGSGSVNRLPTLKISEDGAALMPYETLINPPEVPSLPLHWPWHEVKARIDELAALGSEYTGRRLYLLYNPRTERFNGTTPNFFATMTIRPPGITDRPHRHVSSAINYYFRGSGYSRVEGKRYDWRAGDLMVSAPGWAVHNHASNDGDPVYELTIQDQPLNIYMESLLWQEDLAEPGRILGSDPGFTTSRSRSS